jgi:Uma2 family endonuclease
MASVGSLPAELTEEAIEAVKAALVETDSEPLDSPWHRAAINLLIEVVLWLFRGRQDYFVGGNMFVYYSRTQPRRRKNRGPDFFFVKDVDGTRERLYWWVYEEDNRLPDVIIELLSPTTAKEDRTTKKALYEKTFRTPEYYCFDPDTGKLDGWRLVGKRYEPIVANEQGWLWCEELGVWVGLWEGRYQNLNGTWPRFFDAQHRLLQTETEAEHQRAEAERRRVKKLKAELGRLRARLADKGKKPPTKQ